MRYIINWLETKNPDWKLATLTNEAGIKYEDVSINRTNKKGEVFPMFDSLLNGGTVEGEYWETPDKSKKYLFPPRAQKSSPRASQGFTGGSKMMAEKAKNIEKAQERKSESIAYFNSVNSAIAMLNTRPVQIKLENGRELTEEIVAWRDWFLDQYEKWNNEPNQPF